MGVFELERVYTPLFEKGTTLSMIIAVFGAGYAGLAAVWRLLETFPSAHITLYDPRGIGSGASGIAAGLLHPYMGMDAKFAKDGVEAMEASRELLQIAQEHSSASVYRQDGILRMAVTERQRSSFRQTAENHPEVEWIANCESCHPNLSPVPGLFIKKGITVFSMNYLKGMWEACAKRGARFEKRGYHPNQADFEILCMGYETHKAHSPLPLRPLKGQLLEVNWPPKMAPLPFPINGRAYVVMNPGGETALVGGTYERHAASFEPDPDRACQELFPKLQELIPAFPQLEVVDCRTGIRASTPDHLPILEKIDQRKIVLTGFGSKGLLYHALFAKKLQDLTL